MKLTNLVLCGAYALCVAIPAFAAQSTSDERTNATPPRTTAPGSISSGKKHVRVKKGHNRKQAFEYFDIDRDGYISRSEAQASPELILIFVETDADRDDRLSPTEFVLVP